VSESGQKEQQAKEPQQAYAHEREMRLHPARPPVTRLSRKVLLGLGITASLGIASALFFALMPKGSTTHSELYNTTNRSTPDGLANLPKDYAGLPKNPPQLGPPLPGDLGRPILNAGTPAPGMGAPGSDQKSEQEQQAALTSHLFATTNIAPDLGLSSTATSGISNATAQDSSKPSGTPILHDEKLAFLDAPTDHETVSKERIEAPASPYLLQAGNVIPAALITGLRSDLPGEVTAQVTQSVYDTPTGKILLIPQGARLIGQYDAQIAFGQSRVLLAWTHLIFPNGRSIVLEREPAADAQGYAGLEDDVDNHWGQIFEAAALSTILSVGTASGTNYGNSSQSLAQALQQGASQSFNQTGEQVVGRSLNIQPTITIRPGFPVRVMIKRDIVLEPYQS